MRIETSQIVITTEERLDRDKARAVRGFLGTLFKAGPAFHGHDGRGLVYPIPILVLNLIVAVSEAVVTGFVVEYLSKVRPDLIVQ
jgi:ABC-type Co2+ transport system permease subunit